MNCLLLYYTGTFNTRYLTELLKERLEKEKIRVSVYEINPLKSEKLDFSGYDLLGLGYPIYGFNAPLPFLKFLRGQTLPRNLRVFFYKNSGETYHANDASSITALRILRRSRVAVTNEYHFIMPYNIHFRFDEALIREMLEMDELLLDILVKEVLSGIPNIRKYRLIPRLITFFVKLQFIGGNVNSFFYRVSNERCNSCGLCLKNCPMQNILKDRAGRIRFRHHCLMCMRCSLYCPKDAIRIGLLDTWGWRVNGPYHFDKIRQLPLQTVITDQTTGFFRCYKETYSKIRSRHAELFGKP